MQTVIVDSDETGLFQQRTVEENFALLPRVPGCIDDILELKRALTKLCEVELKTEVVEFLDEMVPDWRKQPDQPWQIEVPKDLVLYMKVAFYKK